MSEAVKKVKVKDVAKDLNISFTDVVAFLNKKGYKQVKNLMSSVEEDMMRDINAHFKKEKDTAERHQRKIAELKETRRRTTETKVKDDETEEVAPVEAEQVITEQPVIVPEEKKTEEFVVVKTLQSQAQQLDDAKTVEDEKVNSPLETLRANRGVQMKGLTVKGKMELVKPKPLRAVRRRRNLAEMAQRHPQGRPQARRHSGRTAARRPACCRHRHRSQSAPARRHACRRPCRLGRDRRRQRRRCLVCRRAGRTAGYAGNLRRRRLCRDSRGVDGAPCLAQCQGHPVIRFRAVRRGHLSRRRQRRCAAARGRWPHRAHSLRRSIAASGLKDSHDSLP